ncbi:MAG TPA: TolC family protein [Spirochaetota bacterium]|nr:TolC family protein [Spirochaetota bacterium]
MMSIGKILSIIMTLPLVAGLLPPLGVWGAPAPKKISLDEAITIAKANNHDYKIALQRHKAESEKVNQAWGMLLPVVESEASLTRQGAESGFMSMMDGQYDVKVVQVKFGINPGMFYNSLQMTRKAYAVSTEELRKVKSDIEFNVIESYFNLILAEEMITIRKDTIKLLQENLKDVNSLYKTGSVPRYELLQAQVQLKSQEPLLLEAENRYRLALEMFNYQLGLDEGTYVADRSIIEKEKYRVAENDIDAFVHRVGGVALKNRPEIIQLRMKKEIAGHAKNINDSYYLWPTFTAGGYYGYNYPLTTAGEKLIPTTNGGAAYMDLSQIAGERKWQPNWMVRVAATYRWSALLPIDSSRAQGREAKARSLEAEEEIAKVKRLITISIKSSYSNLLTASRTISSHRENVDKAREGLRIARESYRAGVIKNSELFGAQVALTQAQGGYINAINSYYQSLAKLRKDIGTDDDSLIFGGEDHE